MNNNNVSKLSRSVRMALLFGTVAVAMPTFAQETEATDETEVKPGSKERGRLATGYPLPSLVTACLDSKKVLRSFLNYKSKVQFHYI